MKERKVHKTGVDARKAHEEWSKSDQVQDLWSVEKSPVLLLKDPASLTPAEKCTERSFVNSKVGGVCITLTRRLNS
jgi:hypothetical protein